MIHFFFTKKNSIVDLLPKGYVDIHTHILPGIDDGARNYEESITMLSRLNEFGVAKFIATPHVMHGVHNNTTQGIELATNQFNAKIKRSGLVLQVKPAAEYFIDDYFEKLIDSGSILTLDGKHILIELSYAMPPLCLYSVIKKLLNHGYVPILAHPERYRYYHNTHEEFQKLRNTGCKFQLNLLSLAGYYGKSVYKASSDLLEQKLIDFTGTDIHNSKQAEYLRLPITLSEKPFRKILENNLIFDF